MESLSLLLLQQIVLILIRGTKSTTALVSFAPIIEMAMTIVEESGGQYHVLLIIADGQVTHQTLSNC